MIKRLHVICLYLALVAISLPVPLLQHETDIAIESMRPVMKMDDGSYVGMLMPANLLFMRWIGNLSWAVLLVVCGFFLLSSLWKSFARLEIICLLALGQSAFTTFYLVIALINFRLF